jgi:hypothetical protein
MAAESSETITVFIKLLSGELQFLEVKPDITQHNFFSQVFWYLGSHKIEQLSISRLVDDEFVSIHLTSDQPLLPQPEEIFSVFINPFTYTVEINLSSTEVWDDNRARYELFDFTLKEFDELHHYRTVTQGIYILPIDADTTPENLTFFLESDQIPAHRFGRFGDEWDIDIPHDMVSLKGIRQLIEQSPLGQGLSDSIKEHIINKFSKEFTEYLDVAFQRDEHEQEQQAWMEEQAQRDLWVNDGSEWL